MRNPIFSAVLLATLVIGSAFLCAQPGTAQDAPAPVAPPAVAPNAAPSVAPAVAPTEISADLGTCSALFNVTGPDAKPIYNAKVSARIRYGFMGTKRLDLETFTSVNGQVKITNLPEVPKKPIFIYVSQDDKMEIVEFKPDVHCRATFDVVLK
jgi:hypothetical protein